ncbi:MAG: hypothetical protein GF311_28360 [Candidatus Lokiarchaeota archaeon]|nr:hypothetical protein [Candidatus Lokiarchaeota archaeon]
MVTPTPLIPISQQAGNYIFGMSPIFLIVFIGVLLLLVISSIGLLSFFLKLSNTDNFSFGPFKWKKEDKETDNAKINDLAVKNRAYSMLYDFEKVYLDVSLKLKEIFLIEERRKKEDIMRVFEDKWDSCTKHMLERFRNFLEQEGFKDQNFEIAYNIFSDKLYKIGKDFVIPEGRRMVDKNDFVLKEKNGEKEAYIDYQVEVLFNIVPQKIAELYYYTSIKRGQVSKWANNNIDLIFLKNEIRVAVKYCFIAANTFQKEIDKINNEIAKSKKCLYEKWTGDKNESK